MGNETDNDESVSQEFLLMAVTNIWATKLMTLLTEEKNSVPIMVMKFQWIKCDLLSKDKKVKNLLPR